MSHGDGAVAGGAGAPPTPTVSELLLFHTGAPLLVVQCGLLKADEGRYCGRGGGRAAGWVKVT